MNHNKESKIIKPEVIMPDIIIDEDEEDGDNEVEHLKQTSKLCNCIIDELRNKPFSSCSPSRQAQIISKGRPTPILTNFNNKPGQKKYSFQSSWYDKNLWLCGCLTTQGMYCWPCILFCNSPKNQMSSAKSHGFSGIRNYSLMKKRHENTREHLYSTIQLAKFGKQTRTIISTDEIEKHNDIVRSNCYILTHMIDSICCLKLQGNDLSEQNNHSITSNGNRENNISTYTQFNPDKVLVYHLKRSSILKQATEVEVSTDLKLAISRVINENIRTELQMCHFVSIILSKNNSRQLCLVLRFVVQHKVQEWLIELQEDTVDFTPNELLGVIYRTLKDLDCVEKLICLTYDGAVIKSGIHENFQKLIRRKYPCAVFLPCHAHQLSWIIQQCVSTIRPCRDFLETCSQLVVLFSTSSTHSTAFLNITGKVIPNTSHPAWLSQFISHVHNARTSITTLLYDMTDSDVMWDLHTRTMARGLLVAFEEDVFQLLLSLFAQLLPQVLMFQDDLDRNISDMAFWMKRRDEFIITLTELQDTFSEDWPEQEVPPGGKCLKLDPDSNVATLTHDILNLVMQCVRERFSHVKDLAFLPLLDIRLFPSMSNKFPDKAYSQLARNYEDYFVIPDLKTELLVMYDECYPLHGKNTSTPENPLTPDIYDTLPQLSKLYELFLCLPWRSKGSILDLLLNTSTIRCESQQVELCSFENQMLNKLTRHPTFYDQVIARYGEGKEGLELDYK